jgi:hypothetical protein
MRIVILAAIAGLAGLPAAGLTTVANAAEPVVTVSYGPKLQKKIDEYGQREVDRLSADLKDSVLKAAAKAQALDDATINLVLEDVVPNRPTFQQMADKPGLSYESFGVGGASISGSVTNAAGLSTPVSYRWYETDIRWTWPAGTWSDAQTTFDRFAGRLARGEALVAR